MTTRGSERRAMRERGTGGGQEPVSARSELLRALARLAEPPVAAQAELARLLDLRGEVDATTYADVFAFQLYPYASVYLGEEGMLGGEARERVAGFWRAVGRTPPEEPDHLAALLALYVALGDEAVEHGPAERVLVLRGRAALLHEHLAPWVFGWLRRVQEIATGAYHDWARILFATLQDEVDATTPGLAVHLAEAPELPDPRTEGGAAFLAGLLAPVRCGMILTRSDLAGLALALGLGLRAGERRYALEHLIAQNAPGVLGALAHEAETRADEHDARVPWLGSAATFGADRARATARLLRSLADQAEAADRVAMSAPAEE